MRFIKLRIDSAAEDLEIRSLESSVGKTDGKERTNLMTLEDLIQVDSKPLLMPDESLAEGFILSPKEGLSCSSMEAVKCLGAVLARWSSGMGEVRVSFVRNSC